MMGFVLLLFVSVALSQFTSEDASHITNVINSHLSNNVALKDLYESVETLVSLESSITNKQSLCDSAKKAFSVKSQGNEDRIQNLFYYLSINKLLACEPSPSSAKDTLLATLGNPDALSMNTLYNALSSLSLLNQDEDKDITHNISLIELERSQVLSIEESLIKRHEKDVGLFKINVLADKETASPFYTGLALSCLAQIPTLVRGFELSDQTMDIVQNVVLKLDKNPLQTTATLIKGLSDYLSLDLLKMSFSTLQLEGITKFLFSSKQTQSPTDAHALLVALNSLKAAPSLSPVLVSLDPTLEIVKENGKFLEIFICNVFGQPIEGIVVIQRARAESNDMTLLTKQSAVKGKAPGYYLFDFLAARPESGRFILDLSVTPEGSYAPIESIQRTLSLLSKATFQDGNLIISSSANKGATKLQQYQLVQQKSLTNPVVMEGDKHLLISFKIKSLVNGRSMNAQQTFAKFTNLNTNKVVSFAAKLDSSNLYEIHLDANKSGSEFGFDKGPYALDLIIGDPYIINPMHWKVATIEINFANTLNNVVLEAIETYGALPLIAHQPKPEQKSPAPIISNIFTVITFVPILVFLVGIGKAGVNLQAMPMDRDAFPGLIFLCTIPIMFGFVVYYWIGSLYLYQLLLCLGSVSTISILFGTRFLASLALKRTNERTKKD